MIVDPNNVTNTTKAATFKITFTDLAASGALWSVTIACDQTGQVTTPISDTARRACRRSAAVDLC
jgi:hypothetical protein